MAGRAGAHVIKCRVVQYEVGVPGAQQVEEVQPALRCPRAEPTEMLIADLLVWTAPDGI
jgi:hypothetical protein